MQLKHGLSVFQYIQANQQTLFNFTRATLMTFPSRYKQAENFSLCDRHLLFLQCFCNQQYLCTLLQLLQELDKIASPIREGITQLDSSFSLHQW